MTLKKAIERIKSRRTTLNYTQRDLAELTGLSERTIRSVENGESSTSMESFIKVLDVLGLEITLQTKPISHEKGEGTL